MKRFLILAFGIMLSAGLGTVVGRSSFAFTSNEDVTARIFADAGMSPPSDSTDPTVLEDLALDDEYPFQNLYLYMYENVLNGPQTAAVKVLSDQYFDGLNFSTDELEDITQNGQLDPILSRRKARALEAQSEETVAQLQANQDAADAAFEEYLAENADVLSETEIDLIRSNYENSSTRPYVPTEADASTVLKQDELLKVYTQIMDAYNKELDLQRKNRKLAYESIANEMFLNNDLADSANIDLLYDLDLAHYVLFGSYITYPDRSGGEDVNLASLLDEPEDIEQTVALGSDEISPYACLDDEALHDALNAFQEGGSGATATPPSSESDYAYADPTSVGGEVSDDPAVQEGAAEAANRVNQKLKGMEHFLSQLSGKKGDWTRSLPCGDVFCITVHLVDGNEDSVESGDYTETDNCVACHVAYINEAMTATTDHSLVAGKVSKNWFEDATCKDAGNQVNFDFNVYAIKKAIDLDPGDDTDGIVAKDVEDLKQTLIHIGALPHKDAPETIVGKTPADTECESLLSLNTIAGSPQSLAEIQAQCAVISQQHQEDLAAVFDQTQVEGLNSNQATLYQQVAAELYKMAITFRNFQEQLQATYKGSDAPLPALLAKKYCE